VAAKGSKPEKPACAGFSIMVEVRCGRFVRLSDFTMFLNVGYQ